MPVLIIYGMPGDIGENKLSGLIGRLQKNTGAPLRLSPSEVSVFFPTDLVQHCLGEELICFVGGLFEGPKRTPLVRAQLARRIMRNLRDFVLANIPQCKKVEVIVSRFNQEVDGFAVCDPHKK